MTLFRPIYLAGTLLLYGMSHPEISMEVSYL